MSLSAHQSARMKSDTWLTPPVVIAKLGPFDFDPCCPEEMPWRTASTMVFQPRDGLQETWEGRVWLNPPFGREAVKWLRKLAAHGNGIALVAARTETDWWFETIWTKATAVLFMRRRPHFHFADGERAPFNSGAPIALVAYGADNARQLARSGMGAYVPLVTP